MRMDRIDKPATLEELDATSRLRSLTDSEARRLFWAIQRKERGDNRKGQRPWTISDMSRLKRLLKRGKKPAQIAPILGRTERAVWRKIYKERLNVGDSCPAHVFTPSRLRVQSRGKR